MIGEKSNPAMNVLDLDYLFEVFITIAYLLVPGLVMTFILSLLLAISGIFVGGSRLRSVLTLFFITFIFSFVAYIVGFISSNTREGAIAEIIPVILSGFGVLLVLTYIKEKIHHITAGAVSIGFAISIFSGLILGGQSRGALLHSGGQFQSFAHTVAVMDPVQQSRTDASAYKIVMDVIDKVKSEGRIQDGLYNYLVTYINPRRNYHFERAYTKEQMDSYFKELEKFPDLSMSYIEKNYEDEEMKLFKSIHFSINPLEKFQ